MVNIIRSIRFTIVFAVILGIFYPLAVLGIGQWFFPWQANGSLVTFHHHKVGSMLIAQAVNQPGLFQPRPSAVQYNADGSGGSNLGPTNPALLKEIQQNIQKIEKQNPNIPIQEIPTSMVESSASGLDPDITLRDAQLQISRIAQVTGLSKNWLEQLIKKDTIHPTFGIWGMPMLNVMQLNLAIEKKLQNSKE